MARAAGLDPDRLDAVMVGLNHTGWTVRQLYDGADVMPLIEAAAERRAREPSDSPRTDRMLHLAATMGSLPSAYLYYYYFREEALETARTTPTTRAEDIVAEVDDYWRHYEEEAAAADPTLDPARSRGGILETQIRMPAPAARARPCTPSRWWCVTRTSVTRSTP
jgi:6-phospho-beta-glucosidase